MTTLLPALLGLICCTGLSLVAILAMVGVAVFVFSSGPGDPLLELAGMLNESDLIVLDSDDRDMTDAESTIVNSLGRRVAFGDPEEVVAEATEHLAGATGLFRESLLNQRGAAHYMAERYEAARADYQAALDDNPEDRALLGNVAEAAAKLGDATAVYALVDRYIELGGDLDNKRVSVLKKAVEEEG